MIEIKGVHKIYLRGKVEIPALQGIDMKIEKGEYLSIMGPSGSGKSTLMNILGCLDLPTRGSYFLDGEEVSNLIDSRLAQIRNTRIGFVFQTFNLLPRFSAVKNVELPLIYAGVPRIQREEKARNALGMVELSHRLHHRPNELSGGECQRVAVARALVNEPVIILADEPTGNLDSKVGQEIIELFSKLNREKNVTVVVVTHSQGVASHSRRIIHIEDGMIR
jgi:putative ABC transport system ATP-binding protein